LRHREPGHFKDEDALDEQVKECWREFRKTFRRFVSDAQRRGEKPQARDDSRVTSDAADAERRRRLRAVEHEALLPGGRVTIEFIGVWDTVCAVGMPFQGLRDFLNYAIVRSGSPT
jgi:hypothetical protein